MHSMLSKGCRTCWQQTNRTLINPHSCACCHVQADDVHALQTDRLANLLHDELMASPELVCMHKPHSSSTCLHWNARPTSLMDLYGLEADRSDCTASVSRITVRDLLHTLLRNLQYSFLFSAPLLGSKHLHASGQQPDGADLKLVDCRHAMLLRRGNGDAQVWRARAAW